MTIPDAANPLAQQLLHSRRARAEERFPQVTGAGEIAFFSAYADSIPERFFNKEAYEDLTRLLDEELVAHGRDLGECLRDHQGDFDIAFRALRDVNTQLGHDDPWPDFDAAGAIAFVDSFAHPTYLKLCESVLGTFVLPIAMRERRRRSKNAVGMPHRERIDEAKRTVLEKHLHVYDVVRRNAIAHGHIAYTQDGVKYRDTKETQELTSRQAVSRCDDMLDLCNGFAIAYRTFYVRHAEKLAALNLSPLVQLNLDEVRVQCESPSWKVETVLESGGPIGRQLNVFVRSGFFDSTKVQCLAVSTCVASERLMPGFDRYFLHVRGPAGPGGWAILKGPALAGLRIKHGVPDLCDVIEHAVERDHGLIVFPPMLRAYLEPRGPLRLAGTVLETFRAALEVASHQGLRLDGVRFVQRFTKAHRKELYAFVQSYVVLECDTEDAISFVRKQVALLVMLAAAKARASTDNRMGSARVLPVGFCEVHIFLKDYRRRRLDGFGLGPSYLCRITLKRFGKVRIVDLSGSEYENVSGYHVHWNMRAVSRAVLAVGLLEPRD